MSPQEIWQAEQRDAPTLTLAQALRRLGEFQARNRAFVRRFLLIQLFFTLIIGQSIWVRHAGQILIQSALAFMNLVVWWGWWRLKQRLTPAPLDAGASVLDTARYYRSELVRELAQFNRRRRERLIANVVAVLGVGIAYWLELPKVGLLVSVGGTLVLFIFSNVWGVIVKRRRTQREIEAVDLLISH